MSFIYTILIFLSSTSSTLEWLPMLKVGWSQRVFGFDPFAKKRCQILLPSRKFEFLVLYSEQIFCSGAIFGTFFGNGTKARILCEIKLPLGKSIFWNSTELFISAIFQYFNTDCYLKEKCILSPSFFLVCKTATELHVSFELLYVYLSYCSSRILK